MTNKLTKIKIILLCILAFIGIALLIPFIVLSGRHTVSFNTAGGSFISSYNYVKDNSYISMPKDPQKIGYEFSGWYYNNKPFNFDNFKVTEDITLIAHWTPINYSISYTLPDFAINTNSVNTYNITQTININPAKSENLCFMGWYNNQNFSGLPLTQIKEGSYGDINLYAKFKNIETDSAGYKIIKESEDLDLLRVFPHDNFVLGNNIDLQSVKFSPIDTFTGILNGNNFKILNLEISGELNKVGLIKNLIEGEVLNLGIESYNINCSNSTHVGVIAAKLSEYSTISNCYTSGNLKIETKNDIYCGGLIGFSSGSTIKTVSNSFSNSNISVISNQSAYVGGLVGYFTYTKIPNSIIYPGSIYNSFSNCYMRVKTNYSSSIFSSHETKVGGLLGDSESGTHHIYNSFAMGTIDSEANKSLNCGYVAGTMAGSFHNCFANSDLTIKENNKIISSQAIDFQKVSCQPQKYIVQNLSSIWDNEIWLCQEDNFRLSSFNDIKFIELKDISNQNEDNLTFLILIIVISIVLLVIFVVIIYVILIKKQSLKTKFKLKRKDKNLKF